ncbi:MAG: hypothetical protein RR101_13595 [Burkholderiaceae bacterium]
MSIESAIACINLVGRVVRPAHSTERWAFARGKPRAGTVIDVRILGLDHAMVVVQFESQATCMYAHELDIVTDEAADSATPLQNV